MGAAGTRRWLSLMGVAAMLALTACGQPAVSQPVQARAAGFEARAFSGNIQHHPAVGSKFLSRTRDVWVYLPPGYDAAKGTRYPVLYMHDGNNVFDGKTAFGGHEWGADEAAEKLIKSGEVAPFIIVGIGNTADRTNEYTWVAGEYAGKTLGGQGSAYAKFLVSELKPLIDKTYRTKTDRANTAVMGSSLGGLIDLYLARHEGDVFGKIGVMSPSVWWSNRAVLAEVPKMPTNLKIWLDMGAREGNDAAQALEDARDLKRALVQRGYAEGASFHYQEDAMGGHNEQAWAYRLPFALKFFFGAEAKKAKR